MNEEEIIEMIESDEFHHFIANIVENLVGDHECIVNVNIIVPNNEKKFS